MKALKFPPGLAPLLVICSMVSLTAGASIAKSLFSVFGPGGVTFLRLALAALIVGLVSRVWRVRVSRHGLKIVAMYGAGLGIMNFFFYQSIARLPIGIAIAIEFLGPLSVSIFFSRGKLDFLWAALALSGILMLLPSVGAAATLDPLGILFALIAAAAWAFYIIIGRKAGTVASSGAVTAIGLIVGALVIAPIGIDEAFTIFARPQFLLPAILVAGLSSAIPYSLEMTALKYIEAKNFGILLSLEPAIGACSAFLFLNERLGIIQLLAIACVIAASIGSTVGAARTNRLKLAVGVDRAAKIHFD